LVTLPPPRAHRVPKERHIEMLRLRLLDGLTLREVGERAGVTDGRVQQILREYFGLRVSRPKGVPAAPVELRVPPGFIGVLREIVECGHGDGIVTALRDWRELEIRSVGEPVPNRVVRRNVRLIQTFLVSAGMDDRSGIALSLSARAVALVRFGLLSELSKTAREVREALSRRGYDEDAERYVAPLGRQDAARALLEVVGWENVERSRPVTVYLDVHRNTLVRAMRNSLNHEKTRAMNPDTSKEERVAAEASWTLLEKLLAAIGGQAWRPSSAGSA
jgi:transcriptional regulator with XRE-family HTH domain